MFEAISSPFLVPFDDSFRIKNFPTLVEPRCVSAEPALNGGRTHGQRHPSDAVGHLGRGADRVRSDCRFRAEAGWTQPAANGSD